MQRFLLAAVVLLTAVLLARDPHTRRADEFFVTWLLQNSKASGTPVPLTVVEIARESLLQDSTKPMRGVPSEASPLEFALFLQSILDFKPTVVAIEPLLKWREREKDQEQIFLDQAMRVPKLILAAELTSTPDPDLPVPEIPSFVQVRGRRGNLPAFSGLARQPDEEMRLISTLAYLNLPEESAAAHVPLLFQYRGEVIPAFALQTFLIWARIPIRDVEIDFGGHFIRLPNGQRIPIESDGSILVNPNASHLARHFSLNELLLLAQQNPAGQNPPLDRLHDELVLVRTPLNPLAPTDSFAATIATLQSQRYIRRVSVIFDCVFLFAVAACAWFAVTISRLNLILGAIAISAAYCLLGFGLTSAYQLWIPGVVPLSAIWLLVLIALCFPRRRHANA